MELIEKIISRRTKRRSPLRYSCTAPPMMSPMQTPSSGRASCLTQREIPGHSIAGVCSPNSANDVSGLAKLRFRDPDVHHLTPDELDLFTTWCTTTYRSLAQDRASKHIWRDLVAREALQCPTLLHSLLALSALELAFYSSPGQFRQRLLATAHAYWTRTHASLAEESTGSFANTSCVSLYAQCNTRLVFPFAYSQLIQPSTTSASALDRLCEIFHHTRGLTNILVDLVNASEDADLSTLVAPQEADPKMPYTATLAILGLKKLNSELRGGQNMATYNQTIDHLNACLAYTKCSTDPGLSGLSWVLRVSPAYLDLVQSRESFALIILAHYCVVLFHLRDRWWMGDWGAIALREIAKLLGREQLASINWAVHATGFEIGI